MSMIPPARPPRRLPRPTPSFVEPTGNPLDALGRNYLRGSQQQVRRQADEGRGVLNFLNPVPSLTSAVAEGRAPRFSDVALDAGLLAAGLIPIGGPAAKAGLTVTGVGDAGRLSALIRRLNKSEDVGDFMTPRALQNTRPNDAFEGLYRPGAQSFDVGDALPEPASPYTFGLVPTEKLAPLREFDRWNELTEGRIGHGNVKKLMEHMSRGGKLDDPLSVSYYPETGAGYLAEGNHRLAMAEQLGLEQLPTRLWRNYGELGRPGVGRNIGELDTNQLARTQFPEFADSVGNYYVPPEMNPYLLKYFQQ